MQHPLSNRMPADRVWRLGKDLNSYHAENLKLMPLGKGRVMEIGSHCDGLSQIPNPNLQSPISARLRS